ncbi:MAG: 1-acyl-sn-glycerol-3-phosphate acyltransferase [Holophagales bacterium]|nr:1-acyl-sn-glycerol-3-phosphate acyltransferase [Holophagales bacterium]
MKQSILVFGGPDGLTELVRSRLATPRAQGARESAASAPVTSADDGVTVVVDDLADSTPIPQPAAGRATGAELPTAVYLAACRAARPGSGRFWGPDLRDAASIFERLVNVEHLILVSSAEAGEPSHRHPHPAAEGQSVPVRLDNPLPRSWQQLERLAEGWLEGAEAERMEGAPSGEGPRRRRLTVVRAAPVLDPKGRDFWSRLFRRAVAFTPPGYDPLLQLLDPSDVAEAVARLVELPAGKEAVELFHLAPKAGLPLRRALRLAGVRRLPVPRLAQAPVRAALSPLGLAAPLAQLDYLRYPFTLVSGKCASRLGFEARRSSGYAVASSGFGQRLPEENLPGLPGPPDPWAEEDPYGLDLPYIRRFSATLFRFLHEVWWRVDHRGLEHVPAEGGAVLTGTHRGHQPWDGVMAMYLIARERQRYVRFLTHPTLVKFPFLAPYMTRLGGVPARREAGDWVLARRGLLGVFPEGIRGAFCSYGPDTYRLCRFGSDDYIRLALRHRVPIVPFVTVGSAEILPILAKFHLAWWRKWSEWPCLPLTPTLGTIPLPSKWHTRFLEPIPTDQEPEGAERDRAKVADISRLVKSRMQDALDDLERRRRWIFWGSLEPTQGPEERPTLGREAAGIAGETREWEAQK